MSNPPPTVPYNTPNAGGGMPKWLIILLVIFIIVLLGCCGGFVACRWACSKAVQSAQTGAEALQRRVEAEARAATQRAAAEEEAQRRAQQGGNAGIEAPGGNEGGGTTSSGGGNPSANGNGASAGGEPQRSFAQELGTGKLPANFPTDIPVMKGLTSSGIGNADKLAGAGSIALYGKVSREDISAYYEKQMKDQGWTITGNNDIMNQTILQFSKGKRIATIQAVADPDKGTLVTISYETKK
jgi:hypothetical protein